MELRVLGPLQLLVDGCAQDLGGPKPQAVLGLLAAAAGRPVAVERLLSAVWGEDAPATSLMSLHTYVAKLRKVLEPGRPSRAPSQVLVTAPPGYALRGVTVDVHLFLDGAARGRALLEHDPAAAVAVLEEALALWRGEPYAGLEPLRGEAASVRSAYATAVEDFWDAALRAGRTPGAAAALEQLVEQEPFRERRWALLARALYAESRQADALDALRRARSLLDNELGLDPSPVLRRLEEDLLAQAPSLAPPPNADPVRPEFVAPTPVLVGRDRELDTLTRALAAAVGGTGQVALVSGEPGIGKTRLVDALAASAAQQGALVAAGRCVDGSAAPPFWPWLGVVRALVAAAPADVVASTRTDLARLLPELGTPGPDDEGARFRVYTALLDLLAAVARQRPVTVVLDDLHWADVDSLRLLQFLATGIAGSSVLLVATHRDAASEIGPVLTETLAVLARLQPVRLALEGLTAAQVGQLLESRTGTAPPEEVATAVRARTDGNPFYIGELARLLDDRLQGPSAVTDLDVPDGVRDVVRRRVAGLPADTQQLLLAGAVLGRQFDLDLVEHMTGLSGEALLAGVETALDNGLLIEEGGGRCRFSHALVQETLLGELSALRRTRLHAAAATAITSCRAHAPEDHVAALADHWAKAGPAHAAKATEHALAAALQADERLAYEEATRLYRVALDGLVQDPRATLLDRYDLLLGLLRARRRALDVRGALAVQAEAVETARQLGDVERVARAAVAVAADAVWTWRDYGVVDTAAVATLEAVLVDLPDDAVELRSRCLATLAVELYSAPGDARSGALVREAVRLARTLGDDGLVLEMLLLQHVVDGRPDRLADQLATTSELLRLVEDPALAASAPVVHLLRGWDLFCACEVETARAHLLRARELAERQQARSVLQLVAWAQATLLLEDGDLDAAEAATSASYREHTRTSLWGAEEVLAVQLFMLRRRAGRLAELEPHLAGLAAASGVPVLLDMHASALVAAGRPDDARRVIGTFEAQPPPPFDYSWLTSMLLRLEVRSALGEREAVVAITDALLPYADQMGVLGSMVGSLGPVQDALARQGAAPHQALQAR